MTIDPYWVEMWIADIVIRIEDFIGVNTVCDMASRIEAARALVAYMLKPETQVATLRA